MQRKRLLFVLVAFTGLLMSFADTDEEYGLRREKRYVADCDCYYELVYDFFDGHLIRLGKLYRNTDSLQGVCYSLSESGDTDRVEYYHLGEIMPFSLYRSAKELWSVYELREGMLRDAWRNHYPNIQVALQEDTAHLVYALKQGEPVFAELYENGERSQRTIFNQAGFDSVIKAYYALSGAEIFQSNCTSCHTIGSEATGPDLRGISQRRSATWLRAWIRNSPKMIADGDAQALQLYHQWHKTAMLCFPYDEAYMDKLIDYLKSL